MHKAHNFGVTPDTEERQPVQQHTWKLMLEEHILLHARRCGCNDVAAHNMDFPLIRWSTHWLKCPWRTIYMQIIVCEDHTHTAILNKAIPRMPLVFG